MVVEAGTRVAQLYSAARRARGRKAGRRRRIRSGVSHGVPGVDSAHGGRSTPPGLRESAVALVQAVKLAEKPARRLLGRADGSNVTLLARGRRKLARAERAGLISSATRDLATRVPLFVKRAIERGDYTYVDFFTEIEGRERGVSMRQVAGRLVPHPQLLTFEELERLYNSRAALEYRRSRGDPRLGPAPNLDDLVRGGLGPHRPSFESRVRARDENYRSWVAAGRPSFEEGRRRR